MAADTPTTQRQARYGISIDAFLNAHQALLEKTRTYQTDTASFETSLTELKNKITSATPAKYELPYNCTMIYPWLFGSAIPDSRQQIDHAVELLGVRAIVTLTPCPLTSPRIFHCTLDESRDNPRFFDPPEDLLDGVNQRLDVSLHHIPMVDAGTPSKDQAQQFLKVCEETREKGGAVLVHCWAGSRRTFCMLKLAVRHFNHYDHPPSFYSTHFSQNEFVAQMLVYWPRMSPAKEVMMLLYLVASLYRPLDSFNKGNPPEIFTESIGENLRAGWLTTCFDIIVTACDGNVELTHKIIEVYEASKERDWPAIFESRGYPPPFAYKPSCYPEDSSCVSERCLISFLTDDMKRLEPYLEIERWKSPRSRYEWIGSNESPAQRQRM